MPRDDQFITPEMEDDLIEAAIKMGKGDFPFTVCWLDDDDTIHYHTIG